MNVFTKIDELANAITFLKGIPDLYYKNETAYDSIPDKSDITEILSRANKRYKMLTEGTEKQILSEKKQILHD